MSEPLDEFESELKRLRPQRPPAEVTQRIAARLDQPGAAAGSDRWLIRFMSAGALAASLIAGLLVSQAIADHSSGVSPQTPALAAKLTPSAGEYQQALARSSNNDNDPALELFR